MGRDCQGSFRLLKPPVVDRSSNFDSNYDNSYQTLPTHHHTVLNTHCPYSSLICDLGPLTGRPLLCKPPLLPSIIA